MKPSRASALGLVAALVLPSLALAIDPPPGGGYPLQNTALGDSALLNYVPNGIGGNTALGFQTLKDNTSGYINTAVGENALVSNTEGIGNSALGADALGSNLGGGFNVSIGNDALSGNTTGSANTAVGVLSLYVSQTGNDNTAVGYQSLLYNSGAQNTALGSRAFYGKKVGDGNIAIGYRAGYRLTGGSNNIYVGNSGVNHDSGVIRLGMTGTQLTTYIAGISGVTVASGVSVVVGTNGQLGTITSSARYKEQVKPMKDASKALLSLKPVTFRYKKELDPAAIPQFGLVAEEVAKVDPDLVARDDSGKPYTVRYEAVNAMLLNEFLKEHRKVEKQGAQIESLAQAAAAQQKENQAMRAQLSEQAALIQKVSARLESRASEVRLVSGAN